LGCFKSKDQSASNGSGVELNFPAQSEKYGKEVAKEMRGIVSNLNEVGYDFTNVKYNAEAKNKFYMDAFAASPTVRRTKGKAPNIETFMASVAENQTILTEIQIKFVDRIINEFSLSKSTKDLADRALKINKDIYATVLSIQQERIFNTAAVLYYGVLELDKLEKEGLLTQKINSPRLKASADSEDGGLGGSCTKFLATGWTIAVGEPTPAGEIVMSVVTVIVAGVWLYEVITCSKPTTGTGTGNPNQAYCQMRYATCTSIIINGCSTCLQYCLVQGYWPPFSTHYCN
jgi:hypothetical protein